MQNSKSQVGTKVQQSSEADVTTSSPNNAKPNVGGSLVNPHDRFKNAALFLCGYLSYPKEKVDEVASIIRRYANFIEPYELCVCQKCNEKVELQFYEGDEDECSYPHYYCPKCRANYYDKNGEESWKELDSHYEDIEEKFKESQFENDDDF
jgi:hypothetical protein